MKTLLVDVDSTIPNLALMRLSAWLRQRRNVVDYKHASVSYYPNKRKQVSVDCSGYDKVYASAVFQDTLKLVSFENILFRDVIKGGTGHDLQKSLTHVTGDAEVETIQPDYSLYKDYYKIKRVKDASGAEKEVRYKPSGYAGTAYGFITRGCPKRCYFCVVPEKEGKLCPADTIGNIVGDFKKVEFLDNNILHYEKHEEVLNELALRNIRCEFNQGLDITRVTETNAKLLSMLNYKSEYTFAFDDWRYLGQVEKYFPIVVKHIPKFWKTRFFIYVHPTMHVHEEVYSRIKWCYEARALPYFMRDISCWQAKNPVLSKEQEQIYTDLAAWCNQPNLFKKKNFKLYQLKRNPNDKERQERVGRAVCGDEWDDLHRIEPEDKNLGWYKEDLNERIKSYC